jgi:hypothetical protein
MKKEKKRNILPTLKGQVPVLSNLLDAEQALEFKELTTELRDTWTKKQIYRTRTEMEISVLQDAKYPTNAAKYWQCVREQNVFLEQLVELSFQYREHEIQLEQDKKKRDKTKDKLAKKLIQVEIDRKVYAMANMQLIAKDRMREIKEWSKFKKIYNDGTFDDQDVNTHQLESFGKVYQNKKNTLTPYSSQPEVFNILGQKMSILRVQQERLKLEQEEKKALDDASTSKKT